MDQTAAPAKPFQQDNAYAWLVVGILCVVSVVGYIDRLIIKLLVDPIKADLNINDTQIGLLQGFSFVLLYAVFAIPVAWVADNGKRTTVITVGIICWSLATFSCGLATTFLLMFLARTMVGLGEVTLAPSGYSLLGDYFSKERVGLAISFLTGAGFLGSGLAYIIGGYIVGWLSHQEVYTLPLLGDLKPWQLVFMVVSIPGLLLALVMLFVIEPPRQNSGQDDAAADARKSFADLFNYIRANARLFAGEFIGFSLIAAATFAVINWTPAFLTRRFEVLPEEAGPVFGLVVLFSTWPGIVTGGFVASFLMGRGVLSANLVVSVAAAASALGFAMLFPLMGSMTAALILLWPTLFFAAMPFGCGTATLPIITPNRLRAQVVAVYLLIANLLGLTLGPTLVGAITDFVFKDPTQIGLSMAIAVPLLYGLGAICVCFSVAPYRDIISRQQA